MRFSTRLLHHLFFVPMPFAYNKSPQHELELTCTISLKTCFVFCWELYKSN
jgi:hypothetical protein